MLQRRVLALRGTAVRRFATAHAGGDYHAQQAAIKAHATGSLIRTKERVIQLILVTC
jgi:hypothetical protein